MGLATGNNSKYVRLWHECDKHNIGLSVENRKEARESGLKWFPYCKGGAYRKWYGNNDYVVDWKDDGNALQTTMHPSGKRIWAHNFNLGLIFRDSITWSDVTSGYLSARFNAPGFMFDGSGTCAFFKSQTEKLTTLGLMNTVFVREFATVLNPTLHFQTGDFRNVPYKASLGSPAFINNVSTLIDIARTDWDNFETSWDFVDLPILRPGLKRQALESSWRNWEEYCTAAIRRMQELETENNCLFIAAYGLEGELQPEVPEDQITLTRADQRKDVASFLSYATGCMMGRYSLDHPGLILANAGDTLENYAAKVGKSTGDLSFQPDRDGIIPVLDGEWFEDDIVARSREFLRVCFPASSLNTNLAFIETALGKDLRKYFCTDFYKDHLQTYKKRPIYWLVQSPSGPAKGGFACLIYLHRYTKDTLNLVLNNYYRPYLQKLEARQAQLGLDQLNDDLPSRDRTAARKEAEKITKVLKDCQAWEQDALLPLAQQRIELDLDDGVKVNYLKLQDVLAPIPGLAAKEE